MLQFATQNNRAVLTLNRVDFIKLHRLNPNHAGIIVNTARVLLKSALAKEMRELLPFSNIEFGKILI